ncbi:MAG: hypothetical protein QM784_40705 [Polyangiaceae bacterium]
MTLRDAIITLAIVVALPVGSAPKARLREQLVVDASLLLQVDLGFEDVESRPRPASILGFSEYLPSAAQSFAGSSGDEIPVPMQEMDSPFFLYDNCEYVPCRTQRARPGSRTLQSLATLA